MPTSLAAPGAPCSRRAFVALVSVAAVVLASVLGVLALPAIVMDGVALVDLLARSDGGFPYYYHALYLPLGAVVELVVGSGRSVEALLWLSAVSGAGAVFVTALAFEREFGPRVAIVGAAAVLASPAFWFMSTNVEVHATQLLGGSVALAAGSFAARRSTARAALLLFLALLVAALTHNSNALLALGPALIASRMPDGRIALARAVRLCAAAFAGAALGLVLDHLARARADTALDDARLDRLVLAFAQAPTLDFYATEFLRAWFPVLLLAGVLVPRSRAAWRAALPFLVGAAPAWFVFLASCIDSVGGYFGSGALFVAGAALAARGADRSAPGAQRRAWGRASAVACVCVGAIGVGLGIGDARSRERTDLARINDQRFAIARAALPEGGLFASLDTSMQYVSGRAGDIDELPLSVTLHFALQGRITHEHALQTLVDHVERAAARGQPLAFNMAWQGLAAHLPQVAEFHELLLERCEQHYRFEPREVFGYPFLLGTPR
jgi:hypothetical protein